MQQLYDACWQAYLDAGAPYGESNDGMLRWFKERGEIARYEAAAERLRALHRDLADLRRHLIARLESEGQG